MNTLTPDTPGTPLLAQKAIEEAVKKFHMQVNELTEKQVCEVILQMIACGDFTRHVVAEPVCKETEPGKFNIAHTQTVTYVPFRELEHYKARNRELEVMVSKMREILCPDDGELHHFTT